MDEPYGYCGMPCALCTRYRTAGTSRCPGCSCGGYYTEGAALLTEALARYNDGRMKRFLCELFIKTDLPALRELMRRAEAITGTPKEAGKAFRALAADCVAVRLAAKRP